MPCKTQQAHCRVTAGGACPVNVDISRFEKCKDERQKVQMQVIEILTHEEDGRKVESTEEEKADAVDYVAPIFARAWARGHRCPYAIAKIIDGRLLGDGFEMAAR